MKHVDGITRMFVYLPDWGNDYKWWLWNVNTMRLTNYNLGGFDIDENAEYWAAAEKHPEISSWHELYKQTGYNPLKTHIGSFNAWISPEGEFWEGDAHMVEARKIAEIYYGYYSDDYSGECETYLIDHGWLKATKSAMWSYYVKDNETRAWITTPQAFLALIEYCELHNLKIPMNIQYL